MQYFWTTGRTPPPTRRFILAPNVFGILTSIAQLVLIFLYSRPQPRKSSASDIPEPLPIQKSAVLSSTHTIFSGLFHRRNIIRVDPYDPDTPADLPVEPRDKRWTADSGTPTLSRPFHLGAPRIYSAPEDIDLGVMGKGVVDVKNSGWVLNRLSSDTASLNTLDVHATGKSRSGSDIRSSAGESWRINRWDSGARVSENATMYGRSWSDDGASGSDGALYHGRRVSSSDFWRLQNSGLRGAMEERRIHESEEEDFPSASDISNQ